MHRAVASRMLARLGARLLVGMVLLGPSIAAGERRLVVPDRTQDRRVDSSNSALAQSRIVYLNKTGVTVSPGSNDSRINRSTAVDAQTTIAGWNPDATVWAETVECIRELYAPFDLTIVESDPGDVRHIEAVFGGTPQQVGAPASVLGISPFASDCSIIEDSIVFTFTGAKTFTAREACEVMAQEIAHSYGLDHEMLASDPMTYLPYSGNRAFKDEAAQCGESSPRPCGIDATVCRQTQNSYQLLRERLGENLSEAGAGDADTFGEVSGGCAAGGTTRSAVFPLAIVVAFVARRRRARR